MNWSKLYSCGGRYRYKIKDNLINYSLSLRSRFAYYCLVAYSLVRRWLESELLKISFFFKHLK